MRLEPKMANDNELTVIEPSQVPATSKEYDRDLDYVRKNQIELIEQGVKGLEGIINVADQSQHPRAYEVLSTYLRTLSELNKDLVITSEKKKEAKIGPTQKQDNITNNLFVGSTKDLQELLKKKD